MNARFGMAFSMAVALGASVTQAALKVDFNDRAGATATQDGWEAFVLPGLTNVDVTAATAVSFSGGIDVTVSPVGNATLVARDEVRTLSDSGSFTLSEMSRDFISARQNSTAVSGEGLEIVIKGLAAGAEYNGRIWSWDPTQTLPASNFSADWFVNGDQVADNWSLSRSAPTDNNTNSFAFLATANASGEIVIRGLRDGTTGGNPVLINGLELTAVPEPASLGLFALGGLGLLSRRRR